MTTVLVTGGTGLVGSAIKNVKSNNYNWIFLSSKDCDLTDYDSTYRLFSEIKPDYVIHLAADVGGLFKNINKKVSLLNNNLAINSNVIMCACEFNVKKLVACLSTCIFPDDTTYPIDETMLHNGPPHDSNYAYAYTKRMLEIQCRTYNEQYNTNFVCIIPTNVYGPNDNFNLEDSHVIPGLIHKCYLAKQAGKPFTICGSGKPLRQFIYSYDLANLIIWTLEEYKDNTPIILSVDPDSEVSISCIANIIADKFEYTNVIYDTSKPDGQYKKTASNKKLRKSLPNFEFTDIKIGISDAIDWFIDNYDNCRK
jgi:GDP-L-fucose synthase